MKPPKSMIGLEDLGRIRLSRYVTMRDMLYSEVGNLYGIPNIPDHPDLAIEVGRELAVNLLDPLFETFGPIDIRSAYRSPSLNKFCNENNLKCSRNEATYASHIWDYRDANGHKGATVTVSIPWFADQYDDGRDWRDLAWWLYDHLRHSGTQFFPKRASFNLSWHEARGKNIHSYIAPRGNLLREGDDPSENAQTRRARYADFPKYRGITYP